MSRPPTRSKTCDAYIGITLRSVGDHAQACDVEEFGCYAGVCDDRETSC